MFNAAIVGTIFLRNRQNVDNLKCVECKLVVRLCCNHAAIATGIECRPNIRKFHTFSFQGAIRRRRRRRCCRTPRTSDSELSYLFIFHVVPTYVVIIFYLRAIELHACIAPRYIAKW